MPLSASDLLHDADAFRRAYPNWPHPEPEPRAEPEPLGVGGRTLSEMVRDERWAEASE
jgi:hypothetical protein